eukprot:GHVL01031794.1.p1 GENE.GHVL01031794.1~~GHVL01031794.1.p1  ORF type:complete len:301 (+),score=50.70 GHVL01031794.1:814-1716(+)
MLVKEKLEKHDEIVEEEEGEMILSDRAVLGLGLSSGWEEKAKSLVRKAGGTYVRLVLAQAPSVRKYIERFSKGISIVVETVKPPSYTSIQKAHQLLNETHDSNVKCVTTVKWLEAVVNDKKFYRPSSAVWFTPCVIDKPLQNNPFQGNYTWTGFLGIVPNINEDKIDDLDVFSRELVQMLHLDTSLSIPHMVIHPKIPLQTKLGGGDAKNRVITHLVSAPGAESLIAQPPEGSSRNTYSWLTDVFGSISGSFGPSGICGVTVVSREWLTDCWKERKTMNCSKYVLHSLYITQNTCLSING